jgi:hypothetical protein
VTYFAKECRLELELLLARRGRRVPGKANDLATVLHPLGIPLMPRELTVRIDLLHIVSFPTMDIPPFMPWRDVREKFLPLFLLDLLFTDWYGKKVTRPRARHTKTPFGTELALPTLGGLLVSVNDLSIRNN